MPDQVMAGEKIKAKKENQKTRHAIAGASSRTEAGPLIHVDRYFHSPIAAWRQRDPAGQSSKA
jgi:hypothetical protein